MATDYDWHPAPTQGSVFKVETRNLGWWVLLAILVSVIIHVLMYVALAGIQRASDSSSDEDIVFRHIRPEQPTINREKLNELLADPLVPEDQQVLEPEKLSDMEMINKSLDEFDLMEQIQDEVVRMAPMESPKIFSGEAPKVPSQALDIATRNLNLSAGEILSKDLQDMRNKLIEDSSNVSDSQPTLDLQQSDALNEGVDTDDFFKEAASKAFGTEADEFVKGYSSLDKLIGQTGGLPSGEEKIALPTDILFEYNEHELKEQAKLSMMKLAFLVQTNPDAQFIIEGHTDSFGGDNFNRDLSLKRAAAVRDWLVKRLRIDDGNIQVIGIGKDRPIVSVDGNADEQALNRRVEIVVKKP